MTAEVLVLEYSGVIKLFFIGIFAGLVLSPLVGGM